MTDPIHVLYVPTAGGGSAAVDAVDFRVAPAEGAMDALERLDEGSVDCVVVEADPPDMAVDAFLRAAREIAPSLPAVVVGADGSAAAPRAPSFRRTEYVGDRTAIPERVRDAVAQRRARRARDRHDRLGRLFRSIARDAFGATSREGVVRVVHEHLHASGCYRFVWIGAYHEAADELSLHAPFEGRLDPSEITAGADGSTPEFVERAVRTGEIEIAPGPATMRSAAATTPDGDGVAGRTMATGALPLHDGDEDYGVVVLVADHPHAFDGAERDLLSDLGEVIARTLGTLEDQKGYRKFATALAHELRSPIGIAETYLDLARDDGDPDDLERAAAAIERAGSIVEDLLSIAGRDAVTDTSTRAVAEDARAVWEPLEAPAAELVIESSAPIEADHDLVARLLANLFGNAIEHAGEEVTVRIGRLEDGFYVADDGPGIPPEERDAVFEWGYADDGGPGIGLSLVRSIADAHGWEVGVTASATGGARFEITGVAVGDPPR